MIARRLRRSQQWPHRGALDPIPQHPENHHWQSRQPSTRRL